MSYLTTIVHPLIIIRLLEHRLFTPLLKKTTTNNTRATPSISLSVSGATSNATAVPLPGPSGTQPTPTGCSVAYRMTDTKMSPSMSFTYNNIANNESTSLTPYAKKNSIAKGANVQRRKCSEGFYNLRSNEDSPASLVNSHSHASQRKHSQASINFSKNYEKSFASSYNNDSSDNYDSQGANDPNSKHSPSHNTAGASLSKKALLKDLSKRILKRVNSGHFTNNANSKKLQKPRSYSKSRKNSSVVNPAELSAQFNHRNSLSSIGQPVELTNGGACDRQTRSNTNSIDRNSHFHRDNSTPNTNDNYSLAASTGTPLDIKEFEKKLINLPTFTISDENASNCLIPNAISNTSLYTLPNAEPPIEKQSHSKRSFKSHDLNKLNGLNATTKVIFNLLFFNFIVFKQQCLTFETILKHITSIKMFCQNRILD